MPYKLITVALLASLSLISVSCDGGKSSSDADLTVAQTHTTVAESLDASELRVGDNLYIFTDDATPGRLVTLELNPTGLSEEGGSVYRYNKLGDRLFTVERIAQGSAQQRLDIALFNLLSGAAGATLNTNLRQLIRRDSPNFSEAELIELVNILSPQGTTLDLANDGQIVSLNQAIHTFLVTSSVATRIEGSMGGTYFVEATSVELAFRRPNDLEFASYRFLTNNDWIPYITTNFRESEQFESGTWSIELTNN